MKFDATVFILLVPDKQGFAGKFFFVYFELCSSSVFENTVTPSDVTLK